MKDIRTGDWLKVELHCQGPTCTLILSGALRGTSIAALDAQVDQLGATRCEEVVIDLEGLTEVDAAGASVLLGLYHYVAAKGGRLEIVGATGQVATTLNTLEIAARSPEHDFSERGESSIS